MPDDLRQFAIARRVEGEGHLALGGLLGLHHMAIIGGILRMVLLEHLQRPDHVLRRHRLAVVPARLGPQAIGDGGIVVGITHGFGEQAVFGGDLVERRRRQRFIDEPHRARDRALHPGDDDVEAVEGAERDLPHRAGLRRGRVDVVEMLEAVGVFHVAEQRQSVPPRGACGGLRLRFGDRRQSRRERKNRSRGQRRATLQQNSSGNCQIAIPVSAICAAAANESAREPARDLTIWGTTKWTPI